MPAARVAPADHCRQSSEDSGIYDYSSLQDVSKKEEEEKLTPYQRVLRRLQTDERWRQDLTLGKRIGFYRIREELGTGNFSQVRAAVHTLTKERVAVKILDKSSLDGKTQKMLLREIASMETVHHPHLIRLYEVMETLSKVYLVMEYASGGELFHRISEKGHFSEEGAKPLFAQITAAVDHMHYHNIVHRDVKAENVFFSSPNTVKVGDFGFSTRIHNPLMPLRTFCGSPPYAAPELFRDDSYSGPPVDVWALGILLYFMLTASMPFRAQTVAGLKKQILEGEFSVPDRLSSDCHWIIRGILKQDPQDRLTMEQMKCSNWLRGYVLPDSFDKENHSEICAPGSDTSFSSQEEQQTVLSELQNFGITPLMLEDCRGKGSRSSVTGTYRITLHKLQNSKENRAPSFTERSLQLLKRVEAEKPIRVLKNRKSKTCNIL